MILAFIQFLIKIGPLTNVLEWFWHKGSLIWPLMTFQVILHFIKNVCLYNVDILEKFKKDQALNIKYIVEKDNFKILRWPYVTFEVILNFMKKLCLHIISIFIEIFIKISSYTNVIERKKLKSRNPVVPKFFLVRYRRTYVLKNKN